MNFEFLMVLCTCPTAESAEIVAKSIIENKLAACVNIIKEVNSIFIWKEKLDNTNETLLIIKTTDGKFENMRQEILQIHPYDCPEIIAIPIVKGHNEYLEWLKDSTAS